MKLDPSRPINKLADFLSSAVGFVTTLLVLLVGVAIGAIVQFSDDFMFVFNLLLSMMAIVISGGYGSSKGCLSLAAARPLGRRIYPLFPLPALCCLHC